MEFGVGSIDELNYLANLVQKHCGEKDNQIKNDKRILDVKEYKYLRFLVFKYCVIPNPNLLE